jgi:hypothetical protein
LSTAHIVVFSACILLFDTTCQHVSASSPRARAHLAWQTPVGRHCIVQRELERAVEELLARDVFALSDRVDAQVDGSIVRRNDGWLARLTLRTHAGQPLGARELYSPEEDCAALNRALIIVLATLLDTETEVERQPGASDSGALPRGFGVGVAAGVSRSLLPASAIAAGALGVFAPGTPWPAFWLEAQGFLPKWQRDNGGRGGRFQAFQAIVSACPALLHSTSLDLAACAGAQLGWLRGAGLGLARSRTETRFTVGMLLEPAVSLRLLPHMSARVSAGLSIALNRPSFYFHAADGARHTIYRPELFGAVLRLGFIVDRF